MVKKFLTKPNYHVDSVGSSHPTERDYENGESMSGSMSLKGKPVTNPAWRDVIGNDD